MSQRVGFAGLGAIGGPMAVHVARHFDTAVWNRTSSKAESFAADTGAARAHSPAELVAAADVVITCLPTSHEVSQFVEAAGRSWRRGQLLIDATSGDPITSQAIATRLADLGAGFVDAPVSGGTDGAEAGKLTAMLGGDERWIGVAMPVIRVFATTIIHVGPVGAGHAVKAINQALLAVNILVAGEGLAALSKLGVSAEAALKVINASSGRSNVTQNLIPQRVVTRAWPRTFSLALLDKDVGIALDTLTAQGVDSELVALTKQALEAARAELDADADHIEAIKTIEHATGIEIR